MKRTFLWFFMTTIFLPHVAFTDEVNVNDYKWQGRPVILKTSQVFSTSEDRKKCGAQDYEICVGAAELITPLPPPAPNNAIVVKCFIPKNQTACPPEIKASEQCFVATAGAPTNPGARPKCKIDQPQNDGLTYGCNCHHYGRPNDIRPTAAICKADKDRRDQEYRDYVARLCRVPYTQACFDHCAPTSNNLQTCRTVRAAVASAAADTAVVNAPPTCTNGSWNHDHTMCICNEGFHYEGSVCVANPAPAEVAPTVVVAPDARPSPVPCTSDSCAARIYDVPDAGVPRPAGVDE